jgi:hypothetical protein
MTKSGATLIGDDVLRATLARASHDLAHLDGAAGKASRLITQRARDRAPKRSGRLASSIVAKVDAGDAAVGSDLIYAPVIHNGWAAHGITPNPFLVPVAADTQTVWVGYYRDDVQHAISQVRGASHV